MSISSRCGDIDREITRQLGVSKAVLENVIFCHQEDSLWPLSEPSALKKKFDEIFSATRYMKALEQIKNLRKEQAVDVKIDKEKVQSVAIHKEKAAEISKFLAKTLQKIGDSKQGVQAIEQEIREYEAELARRLKFVQELDEMNRKVHDLVTRKDYKEAEYKELGEKIQILTGELSLFSSYFLLSPDDRRSCCVSAETDAELTELLNKYKARMQTEGGGNEALERGKRDQELEVRRLQDLNTSRLTEKGKFTSQLEIFQKNVGERNLIVLEANEKHNVDPLINRSNSNTLTNQRVSEFAAKLLAKQRDVENAITTLKAEAAQRTREIQDQISKLQIEATRSQDEVKRNQKTIVSCVFSPSLFSLLLTPSPLLFLGLGIEHTRLG